MSTDGNGTDELELAVMRKRLLFQSNHRGMKETDRIFGGFANAHLDELNPDQLRQFDGLLEEGDNDLMAWINDPVSAPVEHCHDVLDRIIAFKNAL